MPKVHFVKRAQKDNPVVKRGESYYWWKFNFGPRMFSKEKPKRYQLTRSDFLAWLWKTEDEFEHKWRGIDDPDDLQEVLDSFCQELEEMSDDLQDRLDGMPDQLKNAATSGMVLQERIEGIGYWVSDLQSVEIPDEGDLYEVIEELCAMTGYVE